MIGNSKGAAGVFSPSSFVLGLFVGSLLVGGVVVILRFLLLPLVIPILYHPLHTVAAHQVDWPIALVLDIIPMRKI